MPTDTQVGDTSTYPLSRAGTAVQRISTDATNSTGNDALSKYGIRATLRISVCIFRDRSLLIEELKRINTSRKSNRFPSTG
jgi:hypothetical protein